jgi:predicted aldo/keto reductase-like oxidoreductase
VILCTKSEQTRKDKIIRELEVSLKKLRTDYVDVLHEHAHYRSPEGAYERLEFVEAGQKLRKDGKLRFFGVSGHNPTVAAEYIRTGQFDTVMVPYNYLSRRPEAELLPLAKDLDVGIFTIKPLTGRYRVWDQEFGSNKRLDALAGQFSTKVYAEAAIKFVLSNEMLDCMLCGMERIPDVEANVACSRKQMAQKDGRVLRAYAEAVGDAYCRMCETCVPCPRGIAIPDIQRFHMYFANYDHRDYARELYRLLPENAKPVQCADCGECEKKCPFGLPIRQKLREAHEALA